MPKDYRGRFMLGDIKVFSEEVYLRILKNML